jgi:hypothetical protein
MRTHDTTDATSNKPAPEANPGLHANLMKDAYPGMPQGNGGDAKVAGNTKPAGAETKPAGAETKPAGDTRPAGIETKSTGDSKPAGPTAEKGAEAKNSTSSLPHLEIVDSSAKGSSPAADGGKQSMIESAQKTLGDPHASAADKLKTAENLSKNGIKNIQVADSDGKMRDYSIETQKAGSHTMVHMYGKDDNGQPQIALRGVDNGNGTFSQQKDSHGRNVSYEGSNWNDTETGKSNVGKTSDSPAAPNPAQPADGSTPNPAKPNDTTPPTKPDQNTPSDRAPGTIDRSQFDSQLNDPKVMAAFAGRMNSEVGSQGPKAQQAFAEEVMNRAASRGQTLMQALSGSYYPTPHPGSSHNPQYQEAINKAWKGGSDITHGATGNASGHVGFGVPGGHYDAQHKWVSPNQTANIGGERFGYEQVDLNKGWLNKYERLKQPQGS